MTLEFDERGHLPPGRYCLDIEQAHALLVTNPRFTESSTRPRLWDGLERFLTKFLTLEDQYSDLLQDQSLIHRIWMAGSFASAKLDPNNIDATFMINESAEQAIKGKPGSRWLTEAFKSRDAQQRNFGVTPLRIGYRSVTSVFDARTMSTEDQHYFRDRGRWDDWWQRCRLPGSKDLAPSVDSANPVRGYLEVTL